MHVVVPVITGLGEEAAYAGDRTEPLDPTALTTELPTEDRCGRVFFDATRDSPQTSATAAGRAT